MLCFVVFVVVVVVGVFFGGVLVWFFRVFFVVVVWVFLGCVCFYCCFLLLCFCLNVGNGSGIVFYK